jgi:hypothetical protein
MNFIKHDGGRSEHYKYRREGDCVIRAIAIATKQDYKKVFEDLTYRGLPLGLFANSDKVWPGYLKELGWQETKYGRNAVPLNQMCFTGIALLSSHLVAVDKTTIYDTWDCGKRRCWRTWTEETA